jgi:hypothetical protein
MNIGSSMQAACRERTRAASGKGGRRVPVAAVYRRGTTFEHTLEPPPRYEASLSGSSS